MLPAKVSDITFSEDPHLGPHLPVEVEASEALDLWEKLFEQLHPRLRALVTVVWNGEADVEPAELGRRIGELLARMRVLYNIGNYLGKYLKGTPGNAHNENAYK